MSSNTTAQVVRSLCTPEQHTKTHKTEPVTLLALGTGRYGKTATLKFPNDWQRSFEMVTEFDCWCPLFSDLQYEDAKRLRGHRWAAFVEHQDGTLSRPDPLLFMCRVDSKVMEVKPA